MNKLYVVSVLAIASFATVSAESVPPTKDMMRIVPAQSVRATEIRGSMPVRNLEDRPATSSPVRAVMLTQASDMRLIQGIPQITTGDPVIDAQVKALTKEMETKMKAVQDEYMTKIKTIIGTRAVKTVPAMRATTTLMRGEWKGENENGNSGRIRENFEKSTSTRKLKEGAGRVLGASVDAVSAIPVEQLGLGAQFNALFRGLFGGNK